MTKHPGYPDNYHSLIECRELGLCWHCFKRKALKREFCDIPCCSKCKRELTVEVER